MREFLQLANDVAGDKLSTYLPYAWQREWLDASADHQELMICAANRVGKTATGGAMVAMHLTGEYPGWYRGRRFEKPVYVWCAGKTSEASRDVIQRQLLGGLGEDLGTGWVPRRQLIGAPRLRAGMVRGCVDSFDVRHASGGVSTCVIKSFEMGPEKFQGSECHVVWLDEEPVFEIFTECMTRILSTAGLIFVTFTPLLGHSQLVDHFQDGGDGIFMRTASWGDAPHLDEEQKRRMLESYPEHERAARTQGVPKLGEGSVFAHLIEDAIIDPIKLSEHFARIKGWDFGIGHPAGGVAIAVDRDLDVIYVYADYRRKGASIADHCEWLNSFDAWSPISWPHDGENRQAHSGKSLAQHYRECSAKFLTKSARYKKAPGEAESGGAQPVEPIVAEVMARLGSGRLKIFNTCASLIEEMRELHRRDGKIVAKRDDATKALFYAIMMARYAVPASSVYRVHRNVPQNPISTARI